MLDLCGFFVGYGPSLGCHEMSDWATIRSYGEQVAFASPCVVSGDQEGGTSSSGGLSELELVE
ncbi:hypothetical protein HanPSC8_Chr05g0206701 [Helianthus annuus]|nr:hypothetical protein HanIR_Chr05g0230121 [Helianthus annuus]KAJ0922680.1 hypothetical protein HanPSC8_Chr05g0206701 [Helianthus annuus]